jgi:hypothetical protein
VGYLAGIHPRPSSGRAEEYAEFNVPVYRATLAVLQRSGGYIDRNEFDFFVSRIRSEREIDWACNGIRLYRGLRAEDQDTLHAEVKKRIPEGSGKNKDKPYSNWRDVGLHTFSLFSLGTSMVRKERKLMLAGTWANSPTAETPTRKTKKATRPALRLPEPPEAEELLVPPTSAASNDGTDTEALVAKVLTSKGWQVAFYTNRRGYGFDLWARKDKRAMLIEVKSSTNRLGAVVLTPVEYEAAKKHRSNYDSLD